MKPLSESSFNKWRCLIALSFIDRKLQPSEKQFFLTHLKALTQETITEAQMQVFLEDFRSPRKPKEFIDEIEDPRDLIDLLQLAYKLFWSDGEFDHREKRAFQLLRSYMTNKLQMDRFVLEDIATGKIKNPQVRLAPNGDVRVSLPDL